MYLDTDSLQFGFKCGIGCQMIFFALNSVSNHFVARGSSLFIATLDVSEALYMVNYFKLFNYLLDAGVPIAVVEVLCNANFWYSKMFVVIWVK